MLTCFRSHVRERRRHDQAQKRGGGAPHFAVDWNGAENLYRTEPSLTESPETLYARAWAVSLMEEAVVRLTAHYESTGRSALCHALLPALESPLPESTYAELAPPLGLTPGATRSATLRMRHRYRAILLELAAARLGITSETALAEELRALLGNRT